MYKVKNPEKLAGKTYSQLRDADIQLDVMTVKQRVRGVVTAKIIGAVWRRGRLTELICWYQDSIINAFVGGHQPEDNL